MELHEYQVMAAVEHAHWWYRGNRALAAAWLDQHYRPGGGIAVLDAGCGTGGNAEFLRRYGRVAGLDIAPVALKLGQRRLPHGLVRGSVAELPFRESSFDLVTSFDVLYHRAVIDERTALAETRRVLRHGGRLLIRLPAYRWLSSAHDRSVHGRHRYVAPEVAALLRDAGFIVERLSYVNSVLLPVAIARRLIDRIAPSDGDSQVAMPSPIANTLLGAAFSIESSWLRRGATFPAGLSVLALAHRDG